MKKVFNIFTLFITAAFIIVGCSKEDQLFEGTDNGLASFSIIASGVTYNAAITKGEIIISAPVGADLSAAEVKYELCEHASIVPDPGTISDWNGQHVFRIKSYSKTPCEYTYTVLRTDVSQTGNVQLVTQTEVDNFAKLGTTVINGNLVIGSDSKPVEDSIVDLEGLASLKEVRYNIIINRSFAGGTLKGLQNIERCGGLHIGTIASSVEFPAVSGVSIDMPELKSAGDIVLNSNSIKSIEFEKLGSVSSLFVASNSVVALKAPLLKETVGGLDLFNTSGAMNSIMPEISFPKLEKVGGKLSLQWFSGVTAVNFPELSYIGGDLNASLNSGMLEELSFPELATIGGGIVIERVPGLLKLSLPKVKQITSFVYNKVSYGSYPLEILDLPALETVDNEFYLRSVPMETLELPNLTRVGGDMTIWDLKTVTSIKLPLIKKIGSRLYLYSATLLGTLDISTLETPAKLELIGCLSLKTVKSPSVLGDIVLNLASNDVCPIPVFEGLQNVTGKFELTNDRSIKMFEIKNIKKIGTLKFSGGAAGTVFTLFDTEEIGTFDLSSSNIVKLDAPKLSKIDKFNLTNITKLTQISIPLLKTVGALSLSEHTQWGKADARMTDLNAFSGITSIGSVTINYCNKLVDFTGLSGVIPMLSADKWSVLNCGYNPTYQDMVDGKYIKD